jgi:hypothetical protein
MTVLIGRRWDASAVQAEAGQKAGASRQQTVAVTETVAVAVAVAVAASIAPHHREFNRFRRTCHARHCASSTPAAPAESAIAQCVLGNRRALPLYLGRAMRRQQEAAGVRAARSAAATDLI